MKLSCLEQSDTLCNFHSGFPITDPKVNHNMTTKSFYLVGQDKAVFRHDVNIGECHDFEALQVAVAEQYNIVVPTGNYRLQKNPDGIN